ncbi:hypothetical protein RYX36_024524 [Vicia faba]
MYGGPSSKLGRAGPKRLRSSFPPLPSHRPPSSANSNRSLGGSVQKTPPTAEETSSLVSGSNPLPFSMIVKLTPELVEEVKRVEAQGGIARMKYDPNPNNSNGNIIDVGGKEFRFTWSRDGDLCDIYEQCQSGVDGNGLLVESGCAWRKVSVQRILDESAKNHVKMRSKEAERNLKSRKAIVLELGNLSTMNQIKPLAAVGATSGKNYNTKKDTALKKRKVETLQVGGPPKASRISGLMSISTIAKGKRSSLLPSSPDHFAPSSPLGAVKKISGRYFLKPGAESKSFKKPQTESGSLPEENHNQAPSHKEFHNQTSAPQGCFEEKTPNDDLKETIQVKSKVDEESNPLKKIELRHASPDIFGDKKDSDYSEGRAGSSSDSDNDSDSESDSSDSESHSRSRGRSPTGSGSGSSSDSESDTSSSGKEGLEGSDEDVDIMSDDEKEPKHKGETCDQRISLPIPVTSSDGRSMQNEADEKQDGNESDAVDIGKDSPEEPEARVVLTTDNVFDVGKYAEETEPFSFEYQQLQERRHYLGSLIDEKQGKFKDSSKNKQSDSPYRLSKGKHKRGSELNNIDENSEGTKRLNAGNLTHDSNSLATDVKMLGNSRADRQGNSNLGNQKGYNRTLPGKSILDLPQTVQRAFDQSPQGNTSYPLEKSDKLGESTRHSRKHSGKDFHAEVSHVQENRANTSEDMNSTVTKVKPSLRNTNKKIVDYPFKDSIKSLSRVIQTHSQHLSGENADIGSQNNLTESNTKFRNNESAVSHDNKLDGRSESNRRVSANGSKQDTQSGMISYPVKESKRQTANSCEEVADGRKDSVFADRNNSDQKKRESSSDESSCSYLKYEKEEPELKGPITSISQYKEYVLEYHEKYESYVSLNKILQNYSNEFQKLADDLELAKSKGDIDRYHHIVEQINESFGRCGLRHRRLKKIFVVLHEELADIKQKTLKMCPLLIHSMSG